MNTLCLCGHAQDVHYQDSQRCHIAGCGCQAFRTYKVATLPKGKYVAIETETGWDVYATTGESGAFS